MPTKPKKPCNFPGCPNLTDGEFCEVHKDQERNKYNKFERSLDINRKYGREWKRIRDRYVRTHPLCEECLKEGKYTPVEEVHHIVPVSRGGANVDSSLMSLCISCLNKIHIALGDRHPNKV